MPTGTTHEQSDLTRRTFLRGTLGAAAVGAVGGGAVAPIVAPTLVTPAAAGTGTLRPWSMAMHVHACFSEGTASMEAQLDQAAGAAIDVVWWSEHEFRMTASGARRVLHFDGMSETEDGLVWTWAAATSGSFAEKSATFVTAPTSPGDPGRSLRLVGRSTASSFATYRLNGSQTNTLSRTSLDGTTVSVDVQPLSVGTDGYLAIVLTTSHRPAAGGLTAGTYTVEYRVGGDQPVGSRTQQGRTGIVTLGAPLGGWTTLVLDPVSDIAAIWPWVDGRDASLYTLAVGVGARLGARVEAYVDHLRIDRARKSITEVAVVQGELMSAYRSRFPAVTQHAAIEWSMLKQHVNWFGGDLQLPPPTSPPWVRDATSSGLRAATQRIHEAGGVASYNHPFGSGTTTASSQSTQDSARRSKASELITERAYGCDLLEVGYPVKGGVTIGGYLALWDALSRNHLYLTGTGVSDDHSGQNWLQLSANFVTWAWSASTDRADLTGALASGRVYFGNPAAFRGELDLLVDGFVPMGAVSVEDRTARDLRIVATGLPAGSTVHLVRGTVDDAGATVPDPVTTSVALPATALASGAYDTTVDTSRDCFVRVHVTSSSGAVIAGSNPVWLLRTQPLEPIPLPRRVGPAGPVGPRAAFTWALDGRSLTVDASTSTAGDVPLVAWSWDFGDGAGAEGSTTAHTFEADGTYRVVLVVTDEVGSVDTVARDVLVDTTPVPPQSIEHVGSARTNVNTNRAQVGVPQAVAAGDTLLLFATINTTTLVLGEPPGWTLLRQQVIGSQLTRAYTKTATPQDAGSRVELGVTGYAKVALEVLAYRAVEAVTPAAAWSLGQSAQASRPTPVGTVSAVGCWVVSYWVDKSPGTTTSWVPPGAVTVRGQSFGSSGGALATLAADSGASVPVGPCGGHAALASSAGSSATTWTVVLAPA